MRSLFASADRPSGGAAAHFANIAPTLLDRPLVLPILGVLCYFGMVPGTLALGAGLQDLLTCLWTLAIWRKEFAARDERLNVVS